MTERKQRILILGAGLGGIATFRKLNKEIRRRRSSAVITLIDQNNYFTFTPMLHEVASGSIEPSHVAVPIRELLHNTPHQFIQAQVLHINPNTNTVTTSVGDIPYDYCTVALGSRTNFITPGAEQFAHHVRTLPAALALHDKLIALLENTNSEPINLVIVGGGPTGVEVAGQFAHFAEYDVAALYPQKKISITLIETSNLLLSQLPDSLRCTATDRLQKIGKVKIITNTRVTEVRQSSIVLGDNSEIASTITIWTAGFANIANCFLDDALCLNDRIPVDQHLRHTQFPNLFAVGDIALATNPKTQKPFPQWGQTAEQEGIYVGETVARLLDNTYPSQPFVYHNHGTILPIGDWFAIAALGPFNLSGRLVWWIRRTVYVLLMPGFRRKLSVVFDWTLHTFGFRYIIHLAKQSPK